MKTNQGVSEEWEKEFEVKFKHHWVDGNLTSDQFEEIIVFIRQLLSSQRSELLKAVKNLEDNLLGGFIAEIKTDVDEKLWVRIDNYLGKSPSGQIMLIDQKELSNLVEDIIKKIK